ncbi:proline hydroxylase [Glycomyces luteolus]|uniref:Proline hydroxylase n=1 Tax=Glycomyces luteolus TaxID=2670330 RepID=A0A9X3PEP7_9ACTN|nr:proline hydroxylase [Glycomyces luteolus]MDA1362153.1 proline hydroxylase [Glycomyces luteolus]
MGTTASHDPLFRVVNTDSFRRGDIADLAAGRCVAVKVPGFISQSECDDLLKSLTQAEFESYGAERVYPQVMRFGIAVSDFRKANRLSDGYWDALDASGEIWQQLGMAYDPFAVCRERLGADLPAPVEVGTAGGRAFNPGVFREPNGGFQVHFDDARREFDGDLVDAHLVAQFAFNLYLSVPSLGGETVMWRHLWEPADEEYRLPNSYGYAEDVVREAESVETKPVSCEVLLLNPRYFHAVRPSRGARRISLGFSVGLTDTGQLLTWG